MRKIGLATGALMAILLVGCTNDAPEQADPSQIADALETASSAVETDTPSVEPTTQVTEPLALDRLPKCADIRALPTVSAMISGLRQLPDGDTWETLNGGVPTLMCNWGTEALVNGGTDLQAHGVLGVLVSIRTEFQMTPEDGALAGMRFEDPRVDSLGGWVLASPNLDLTDRLGPLGPQVIIGDIEVAVGATGQYLAKADAFAHITSDMAVQAGLEIPRLFGNP